jgi:hypothetical protein
VSASDRNAAGGAVAEPKVLTGEDVRSGIRRRAGDLALAPKSTDAFVAGWAATSMALFLNDHPEHRRDLLPGVEL